LLPSGNSDCIRFLGYETSQRNKTDISALLPLGSKPAERA